MSKPQTILISLPDGSPRSVKIAEITNRVVKAVLIPRNKLEYIGQRDEVKGVGLGYPILKPMPKNRLTKQKSWKP
jgi:hypothetical protein